MGGKKSSKGRRSQKPGILLWRGCRESDRTSAYVRGDQEDDPWENLGGENWAGESWEDNRGEILGYKGRHGKNLKSWKRGLGGIILDFYRGGGAAVEQKMIPTCHFGICEWK